MSSSRGNRRIACVAVGMLLSMCSSANLDRHYPNLARAQTAGAFAPGPSAIPTIIPGDGTDLHVFRDGSSRQTWGCFRTRDFAELRLRLRALEAAQVDARLGEAPRRWYRRLAWWPNATRPASSETWEWQENSYALIAPTHVRVHVEPEGGRVCFHRAEDDITLQLGERGRRTRR